MGKTINVNEEVYNDLIALQGFLQLREGRKISLSDVVAYLLTCMPDDAKKGKLQHIEVEK